MSKVKDELLRVKEAANRLGKSEQTVRTWLKQNRFEGAFLEETPLGSFWQIPASSVDAFALRKAGRPRKPISELKGKPRRKD